MTLESQIPDHLRFKDCEPLSLLCLACKQTFEYRGLNYTPPSDELPVTPLTVLTNVGLTCPRAECKKAVSTLTLSAQLSAQIRRHVSRYTCDDTACGIRTRHMSVYGHRCLGPKGLWVFGSHGI